MSLEFAIFFPDAQQINVKTLRCNSWIRCAQQQQQQQHHHQQQEQQQERRQSDIILEAAVLFLDEY